MTFSVVDSRRAIMSGAGADGDVADAGDVGDADCPTMSYTWRQNLANKTTFYATVRISMPKENPAPG